jgi:hypothetical protein
LEAGDNEMISAADDLDPIVPILVRLSNDHADY